MTVFHLKHCQQDKISNAQNQCSPLQIQIYCSQQCFKHMVPECTHRPKLKCTWQILFQTPCTTSGRVRANRGSCKLTILDKCQSLPLNFLKWVSRPMTKTKRPQLRQKDTIIAFFLKTTFSHSFHSVHIFAWSLQHQQKKKACIQSKKKTEESNSREPSPETPVLMLYALSCSIKRRHTG